MTATPVAPQNGHLPDDVCQRLDAVIEGDYYWRSVASVTEDALGQVKLPKTIVYQAIANRIGKTPSAIRSWLRYEQAFGDWLDEIPFHVSIEQLRLCLSEAKSTETEPLEIMEWRLDEGAQKYDGRLPPVEVWRAELRGKRDKRDPFASAIDRACQSANTAWKKMPSDIDAKDKVDLTRISKTLDALAEKYCNE